MAVAKLLVSNNSRQQDAADHAGVHRTRVAQANTVLKHAPELAEAVLAGTEQLDAAYVYAKQRKEEQASRAPLVITRHDGRYRRPAPNAGCRDYP